jgi:hypothetical protein
MIARTLSRRLAALTGLMLPPDPDARVWTANTHKKIPI